MISIDYRNAKWEDLQATLQGKRLEVLDAWRRFGPGTTRTVAEKSGIDLLTLRPRTTELVGLGLVVVVDEDTERGRRGDAETAGGHEGIYRAVSDEEALALFRRRCAEARKEAQLDLAI